MNKNILLAVGFVAAAGLSIYLARPFEKAVNVASTGSQIAAISGAGSGLVAHWTFDEGSGTSLGDSVGGWNGTLMNGPSWTVGIIGGALSFDGADDHVNMGDVTAVEGLDSMTVSSWVRSTFGSGSAAKRIAGKSANSAQTTFSIELNTPDKRPQCSIRNNVGVSAIGRHSTKVTDSGWHLVTCVYDGSSVRMYLDGEEGATVGSLTGTTNDGTASFLISATSNGWQGDLDDMRIYNRALSASEITELYAYRGSGGSAPSPDPDPTPSPVNGSCGASVNTCSAGIFSDTTDTSTQYRWQCLGQNGGSNDSCSATIPAQADTAAPVLSNIRAQGVDQNSATITWTTDEDADTYVDYGTTASYGLTSSSAFLSTSHSRSLSNLSSATTYHYRVRSTDDAGNVTTSDDQTFTTDAAEEEPLPPQPSGTSWTPPIGIPRPSFGIEESYRMYDSAAYRNPALTYTRNSEGGYYTHYISTSGCTDTNNPYGTASNPRCRIPLDLPEGSVVEVHGGPYTYRNFNGTNIGIYAQGTAARPVFVRGLSQSDRPTIQTPIWLRGQYVILENILFDMNQAGSNAVSIRYHANYPTAEGYNHHISIRYSEARNASRTGGSGAVFSHSGIVGSYARDLVYYNNRVHADDVDILKPDGCARYPNITPCGPESREKDTVGISIAEYTDRVWIVDNVIYGNGGDSVGAGHGDNYTARNYYIGRNDLYDNGENAADFKEVENVVVSQNKMHDMYGYSAGSDGSLAVIHYGPTYSPRNFWFLYNELYDASDTGFQVGGSSTYDSYIIGNIFHDIGNSTGDGRAFYLRNSQPGHLIGNVFYDNDSHIVTGQSVSGSFTVQNNILGDIRDTSVGFHIDHESSATGNNSDMRNNILYQSNGGVRVNWGGTTRSDVPAGECGGCIYADPRFVNAAANDFRLQSNSPAINAGVTSSVYSQFQGFYGQNIARDFVGNSRPSGSAWDIGSYEFGGTPSAPQSSTFVLAVTRTGTGSGTVTGAGISCGADCSEALSQGASVTLTASPSSGSTFIGWSGACSGTGVCAIILNANSAVTANFDIATAPTHGVCGSSLDACATGSLNNTADSSTDYIWQCIGSNGGTSAECSLAIPTYTLAATRTGTGSGTISGTGISCGTDCTHVANTGTTITLTATPASGSMFTGWSGACSGTGSCTLTLSSNATVAASFNQNSSTQTPMNGSCGATENLCGQGALSDTADSATHFLWRCAGSNGGTTASCSLQKPVTNGSCGASLNACALGSFSDASDSSSEFRWQCQGSNGGQDASCSLTRSQESASSGGGGGGGNTSGRTNGICGTSLDVCSYGTFEDASDSSTAYRWTCSGINGGKANICSLTKSRTTNASIQGASVVSRPISSVSSSGSASFTRDLQAGMTGSDVQVLQKYLNSRGFLVSISGAGSPGQETSLFGPATKAALIRFQQANGLSGTGYFGPLTRALLSASSTTYTNPFIPNPVLTTSSSLSRTLYRGLSGEDVRILQELLNQKGYLIATTGPGSPGNETTFFGAATEAALERFQCAALEVCSGTIYTTGYGLAGQRTRAALGN